MGIQDLNPWSDDFDKNRALLAAATMGMSEAGGLRPIVEEGVEAAGGAVEDALGGGVGGAMGWLADQGAAAFPGQVDQVDQSVDLSFQTPYVTESLDSAYDTSDNLYGTAYDLEDMGHSAQQAATQDANTAQGIALTVGQEAFDTSQAGGQALQGLGQTAYDQAASDQAQLEQLGQYLGLSAEQLAGNIYGQTAANANAIEATGDQYAGQFQALAGMAMGGGVEYNPELEALANQSVAASGGAANQLTNLGAAAGQTGAQGASALTNLAAQTQGVATDMYGRAAPTYTPEEQRAMLLNASGYADDLAMLEATQGPSGAQAQFNILQNQAMQDNLALARSGSGFGENAQAMSQAINANALAGQDAANQAALLKAQEDAAWRERAAGNFGAAAQLGLGAGAQYGEQAQFQANLQQAQSNANAQNYLQAMSLATDQTQAAAATALQGLAQQGQLTEASASVTLQGLVQSGQLTQQAADNLMRGIQTAGGFTSERAQIDIGAEQAASDLMLQGGLGAGGLQLQGADQALQAIQGGISAGQAGTALAGDLYGQGTDTMLAGNQLGLQAIDSFLAASGHDLAGYQTADQLLNSAMGGQVQANAQNQAALQLALDTYNQAVANEQNWEQLGLTQEQAETQRQSNYFELIGALANAVGEAIPG